MKNHYQSTLLQTHLERLKSSPSQTLLLDGGTGEELFLRGVPDDRKIWSATAVVHSQHHSILRSVHESFIEAGSDAITTNSYGIVPGVGFRDGEEVVRLMGLAGEIARKAATAVSDVKADESGKNNNMKKEGTARALVLGSLGPLVESYRPDLIMNRRDGVKCYRYAIEGLYPHIDVFLAETMSCLEEVCQVVDALSEFYEEENNIMKFDESLATRHPLLVSFTLGADGKIRNGDSVVEVIPKLVDYSNEKGIELIGVMFNCCEPESITKALKEIQTNPQIHHYLHHPPHSVSKIPESTTCGNPDVLQTTTQQIVSSRPPKIFLGAYANRLTPVDPDWTLESSTEAQGMREDLSPERYWNEFVRQWHDEGKVKADIENSSIGGMQLIGGCCGIGPDYIARLKTSLKST